MTDDTARDESYAEQWRTAIKKSATPANPAGLREAALAAFRELHIRYNHSADFTDCDRPTCVERRAALAATEPGLTFEGAARKHYEPQRHFFEPPDGDGVCSVCGEFRDEDFLRITIHFNDGDG